MLEREEEKRNKKIGMMISAGLHALLLVAFLFILAWKEPDPPLPEYGIELNFGLSDAGSGDVQPVQPTTPSESEEEAIPEALPEEVIEQPQEEVVAETAPPEDQVAEVEQTTSKIQESEDVLPEETEEKQAEESVKAEQVKKTEEKEEPARPVETKTPDKPATGANGENGEREQPQNTSQGDDSNTEGDKGDEEGKLDARALYGQSGGGAGPALSIVGWTWDEVPNQKDKSSENGTIVFRFIIDQDGYVINVQTVESSVSPGVTKFYEDQLRQTTFSKTGTGVITSATTTGTVTFVIKSR